MFFVSERRRLHNSASCYEGTFVTSLPILEHSFGGLCFYGQGGGGCTDFSWSKTEPGGEELVLSTLNCRLIVNRPQFVLPAFHTKRISLNALSKLSKTLNCLSVIGRHRESTLEAAIGTGPLRFVVPQTQRLWRLLGPPQEDRSNNSLANWLKSLSVLILQLQLLTPTQHPWAKQSPHFMAAMKPFLERWQTLTPLKSWPAGPTVSLGLAIKAGWTLSRYTCSLGIPQVSEDRLTLRAKLHALGGRNGTEVPWEAWALEDTSQVTLPFLCQWNDPVTRIVTMKRPLAPP